MKAAICTAYGPPEVVVIKDIPKPLIKNNQVLVRIKASAVNSGDVRVRALQVSGFLRIMMRLIIGFTKPRKAILGTVYAGVIEEIGANVTKFKVGDEVYGLTGFNFGGHAEYIAVKEKFVMCHKPQNASFEQAAAILFGGQTAYYFLHKSRIAQSPQLKTLIYGSSGAVGTAAIQIAKYYKADITVICSESSNDLMRSLKVNNIINYDVIDLKSINNKFDLIFDAHGSIKRNDVKHLLNPNSQFLSVGSMDYAKESVEQIEFLKKLYESGNYTACIDKSFSLEDIVNAYRYVDTGKKKGNVILSI